jgi:hypothetical protein
MGMGANKPLALNNLGPIHPVATYRDYKRIGGGLTGDYLCDDYIMSLMR